MRSIPMWKLKRELRRIPRQIAAFPAILKERMFGTLYYDLVLSKDRKEFLGEVAPSKRVAIYLIFPRNGVLPSHLRALDYIISSDYAPLVISNLPLAEQARNALLKKCWKLIERPNVGYDFGGYRDGILSFGAKLKKLDRLVLLNDSTWFPLPDGMDWLRESEVLNVDYAAAAWMGAVRHPNPEDYEDVKWKINKTLVNFHYASFALNLSKNLISSTGFRRFWKNFKLTREKNLTVRRGEIGLTSWVLKHGFSHGATTELTDLPQRLAALGEKDLRTLFDRLISVTDPEMVKYRKTYKRKLSRAAVTRAQTEKIILCSVSRQGASYAIADFLVRHCRFAFLKKSPAANADGSEKIMLDLAESLPGSFGAEILAETRAIIDKTA